MHRPGDPAFRRGFAPGEGPDEGGRSAYRPFRPEPEDQLLHPGGGDPSTDAHVDNTPPGFDDRPPLIPPPPVPLPQAAPPPAAPPPAAPPPVIPPPAIPPSVSSLPAPTVQPPFAPPPPPPIHAPITVEPPEEAESPEPPPPPIYAPPPPVYVPPPLPIEAPAPPPPAYVESAIPPPPPAAPDEAYDEFDPYDYRYAPSRDDRDRPTGGMSALAIGGFVLLGILAIGVGAFISGIFGGGVAQATATPTPTVSVTPSGTAQATLAPTPSASAAASPTATQGAPFTFPDGFSARTEPCLDQPESVEGCDSSGASVSGGSVWIWVGWRKGTGEDLLTVTILDASGASVGDVSRNLSAFGCGDSCSGWAHFRFTGLALGNYTIRVDRNGQPAAEAAFTVTG